MTPAPPAVVLTAALWAATAAAAQQSPGLDCQLFVDRVAKAVATPPRTASDGSFVFSKAKVASLRVTCPAQLSIEPDPEPFAVPLSPSYPGLVTRVLAAAFDLPEARITRAVAACIAAAVPDPPTRSSRAGMKRQAWRNSQMKGEITVDPLRYRCIYNGGLKKGAAWDVSRQ